MINAAQILEDLQRQARAAIDEFDMDEKANQAKDIAGKIRERLDTDPNARNAAAGASGLLLLGMLGTRGGRRLIGNVAKTGAAAALGAFAYKAWNERRGQASTTKTPPEFIIDVDADPAFSLALVRAMIAGAYADGTLSEREEKIIRSVIEEGGFDDSEVQELLLHDYSIDEDIEKLIAAATTPNKAAQLYAGAALTADHDNEKSREFLDYLAEKLGIDPEYATALHAT